MRLLLVDHGCCDGALSRGFRCRDALAREGIEALLCGPATVSPLEAATPGLHGIPLKAVAAGNRAFAAAVRDGDPDAFLRTSAGLPAALLGLVRETARQAMAEAVDGFDPAAILVLHAGIFADLAVETGLPVVILASTADLAAARRDRRVCELVAAALASAEAVVPADDEAAAALAADWLDDPDPAAASSGPLAGPVDGDGAASLAAAVRLACRRRGG